MSNTRQSVLSDPRSTGRAGPQNPECPSPFSVDTARPLTLCTPALEASGSRHTASECHHFLSSLVPYLANLPLLANYLPLSIGSAPLSACTIHCARCALGPPSAIPTSPASRADRKTLVTHPGGKWGTLPMSPHPLPGHAIAQRRSPDRRRGATLPPA